MSICRRSLLLPQYYVWRPPHMPPITFGDAAILPLGIALFATELRRWRLQWMDLWVLLFAVGTAVSEGLSADLAYGDWVRVFSADSTAKNLLSYNMNNGVFEFFANITTVILPYMVGKLLIERGEIEGQPVRKAMVSRMVVLVAIVGSVSVFDFFTGTNSWQRMFGHLFPGQFVEWPMQVRWGFVPHRRPLCTCHPGGNDLFDGADLLSLASLLRSKMGHAESVERIAADSTRTGAGVGLCRFTHDPVARAVAGSGAGAPLCRAGQGFLGTQSSRGICGFAGGPGRGCLLCWGPVHGGERAVRLPQTIQSTAIYRRQLLESYTPVCEGADGLRLGRERLSGGKWPTIY